MSNVMIVLHKDETHELIETSQALEGEDLIFSVMNEQERMEAEWNEVGYYTVIELSTEKEWQITRENYIGFNLTTEGEIEHA
ncbi:hypothetical protein [Bacillus paranthracis]|uniref:hypothetical protein n=1 Tax=Bacillus paranthracis TaxID=2026186 RepID=UPI003D65CD65